MFICVFLTILDVKLISNQALFDRLVVRALHVYQKKGTSEQHVN